MEPTALIGLTLPVFLGMQYFHYAVNNARGGERPKAGTFMKGAVMFSLIGILLLLAGYFFSTLIARYISGREVLFGLVLMALIGFRILLAAYRNSALVRIYNIESSSVLLALAVALGINQLFAGVVMYFLSISLSGSIITLGISIWLFSFSGFVNANHFKPNQGKAVELVSGGMILLLAFGYFFL